MGCSSRDPIKEFNEIYKQNDENNSEIYRDIKICTLHQIGQEGFEAFCRLNLSRIENLDLSENNIECIKYLLKFKANNLKKLNLSKNNIVDISILEKVNYPLETLDLRYNRINDISILKKDSILKDLRVLLLINNDINFKDEKIKNILSEFEKRGKCDSSSCEISDDSDYSNLLKRIRTINSKCGANFCAFDRKLIDKLRHYKNITDEEIKEFEEALKKSKKLAISVIVNDNGVNDKQSENITLNKSKTYAEEHPS